MLTSSTKVAVDVKPEGERAAIDEANAKFWDELCGSGFARALGISNFTIRPHNGVRAL